MDWELLLIMLPLGILLWWAGFAATRRMRIEKNREREALARRLPAEKAAREAIKTETEEKQESH